MTAARSRILIAVIAGVAVVTVGVIFLAQRGSHGGAVVVADAAFPAAMAPLSDGGFLYGERLTGTVRMVRGNGTLDPQPLAVIPVDTVGEQRGLLGLVVDGSGGVFASFIRPDGRLTVAALATGDGPLREVWVGPMSADRANGGRIAFAPDGSLVIGVGDLLNAGLARDPSTPNGKMLALDPRGSPDQTPTVISSGWNNPFAFVFAKNGTLYVADNAGGESPERLAIGNRGPAPIVLAILAPHTVPSGIATIPGGVAMCSYLNHTLMVWRPGSNAQTWVSGPLLADDCSIGVIALSDGSLRYSNETQILATTPG